MTRTLRNFFTVALTLCCALMACGMASGQTAVSSDSLNSVQSWEIKEQQAPAKVPAVKAAPVKTAVQPVVPPKPAVVKPAPVPEPKPQVKKARTRKIVKSTVSAPRASSPVSKPAPAPPPAPVQAAVAVQEQAPAKPAVSKPEEPRIDRVIQFAQAERSESPEEPKASPIKTGVSIITKLAIVLLLAYFSILALKLLYKRQEASPRIRRDLKVMDTVKLSQTSSLHVVDFNGKKMLVGCSAGQVNLLREFDQEDHPEAEEQSETRFAEYLAKYSGSSFDKTPAGRVAGMLRDCAAHLRDRRGSAGSGRTFGDKNEA